jgi:hypothetical protein
VAPQPKAMPLNTGLAPSWRFMTDSRKNAPMARIAAGALAKALTHIFIGCILPVTPAAKSIEPSIA